MLIANFIVLESRVLLQIRLPALGHQQEQRVRCYSCSRTGQYWSAEARHGTRVWKQYSTSLTYLDECARRNACELTARSDNLILLAVMLEGNCKPICPQKQRQPDCGNKSHNRSPSLQTPKLYFTFSEPFYHQNHFNINLSYNSWSSKWSPSKGFSNHHPLEFPVSALPNACKAHMTPLKHTS
jgi:hypothetical protein